MAFLENELALKNIITQSGIRVIFEEEKMGNVRIETPKGLRISLMDEQEYIIVSDKDRNQAIMIDSKNQSVTVKSADKLSFEAKAITIKGSDEIKLESKAITLDASEKIMIKGGNRLECSGNQTEIKGGGKLIASGTQVEIKSSATLKLEGSAMTEIKGGIVKING